TCKLTLMKQADWIVRGLVAVTFVGLLFAPGTWGFRLILICFAVVGTWAMLYPQGVLGWAKTAHPSIDLEDSSIWWIPRLIGACFVVGVLLVTFIAIWQ